ncbi:mechanosensitive ion channel family protein [Varunaivibrio sulfuroxidans]|uniref:MscS family membrane protein n=1 Tax=Varunaivibrio sulfuroxidans TaxID=1773489 RepID=A0A4R3JHI5_9PROT|nr:mechanosensitive ion channel family protein [Varunaivibrio sulfuroxidans]TCS64975.1 MscS family membrane protein [Varunaivibrio sulfuroxidans]WES29734.1 mechanosensitive ion channel family protein [Varunaivibrio sulfuroxidans]
MGQDIGVKLEKFWVLVVQVWRTGVLGIDIGHILGAMGIFLVFIVLRRVVSAFIMARLEAWTRRTKTDIDNRIVDVLEPPIQFIPIVLGAFFAVDFLNLRSTYALLGDNIVRSLIVFTIFWAFHRAVAPLSDGLKRLEKLFTAAMLEWLVKAIKAAIIFIGAATILQIWGIQVGPLIAGLGLFGVAVALGAQDLFKNLIAGLLVIAEKRFNQGDWILVEGTVEGTVESIGFRSTLVRRFDKAPVYVPNSKLSDTAVVNFSKMTHRRIYWKIGVVYSTTVAQLRQIRDDIEAYVLAGDDFAKPPEVAMFVRIDRFNDSSIDIMLYCFTKTTVWGEWLAIKEQLAYHVKEVVEGAGSSFAFPSRSLYVETPGADQAETFLPPNDTPPPSL